MRLWTLQKIMLLACLPVISAQNVQAGAFQQTSVTITGTEEKPAPVKQSGWHELRGSLDREPVYLMIEKLGRRQVAGYLFDRKGNKQYIYGEWFKNELQIYNQANKRLTIILPE